MNSHRLTDINIERKIRIPAPSEYWKRWPLTPKGEATVENGRETIRKILRKEDFRKIAIVGPCSIHDVSDSLKLAEEYLTLAEQVKDCMFFVMRAYTEKPRTGEGWEGLVKEPAIDGSPNRARGLAIAREFLIRLAEMGMPVAMEFVDTKTPHYLDGLVSWACIGARSVEVGNYRAMASGLSMPVGIKNGTTGTLDTAIEAVAKAQKPGYFSGIDDDGRDCDIPTRGNAYAHLVLRGGNGAPNYDAAHVKKAQEMLTKRSLEPLVLIDCSHGNCIDEKGKKDYRRQLDVCQDVIGQVVDGNEDVIGFMIEANMFPGSQDIPKETVARKEFDQTRINSGYSITDPCLGHDQLVPLLRHEHMRLQVRYQVRQLRAEI